MREIKFRAWDKEENEINHHNEILMRVIFDDGCLVVKDDDRYNYMQYTGLKDKNGKEIYEGDILKKVFDDSDKPSVVQYVDCCFVAYNKELNKYRPLNTFKGINLGWDRVNNTGYEFEVIGNVYQNSELIRGDECE